MRYSLPLLVAALAASTTAQVQQALVPSTHHLGADVGHTAGSLNLFRSSAGRFVVVYEAAHFTASGITGQITIGTLRFRGEDTECNQGGQSFAGATVQLGTTSLTTATLSPSFATNWAPIAPDTTTPAPVGTITSLNVAPSLGTSPNNFHIEIDLLALGSAISLDPNSAEPNLLVEIVMPNAPGFTIGSSIGLVPTQQVAANTPGVGCFSSSDASGATGGLSENGPVMNLEFFGNGGYQNLVPARVDTYGAGCNGSTSGFYEEWKHTQRFDLANRTLVITPDSPATPNLYTVTAGTTPPDLTRLNATPNSTADDLLITFPLGYAFNYVGGVATQLRVSTNGFIFLDNGTTTQTWVPTRNKWLGTAATETVRFAPLWHDFHCGRNSSSNPNSGLHIQNDTSAGAGQAVTYVTWFEVARANVQQTPGGHSVNTFQAVFHQATGVVEFRYGNMTEIAGGASSGTTREWVGITGFTRGNIAGVPSKDPQSRDLSLELPFVTSVEGGLGNLGLQVAAAPVAAGGAYGGRAFAGQSLTWNVDNVPLGTVVGVQLLDFASSRPGLVLPSITAPGCVLSVSTGAVLWDVQVWPAGAVSGAVPLAIPPGFDGLEVYAQYVVLGGLFGGADLISAASNAVRQVVGRR
jgi:hypothetical protein